MKFIKIIKLAIFAIVILAIVYAAGNYAEIFPKLGNLLEGNLEIDKTANVITEIKKISEFTTACFFEEGSLVEKKHEYSEKPIFKKVKTGNRIKDLLGLSKKQDGVIHDSVEVGRIAFIIKGKVRAGYDLSKLDGGSLINNGDTLFVHLPEVEIFDVIVNPSDIEEFDRKGNWSEEEINVILGKAKEEIKQDAIESGLIQKAETSGRDKFVSLFKTFGFNEVIIQ